MARSIFRWFRPATHLALLGVLGALWCGCRPAPAPAGGGAGESPGVASTVRIALHADPASLDPHLQSEVIAQTVLGNVYDALVTFDADMRLVPQLAKTWSNPDELTWRFELRRDAKFHDGRAVTAADVVGSLERVRNHPLSRQSGSLVAVDSVVAVDEFSVEVQTQYPYAVLLNKLAYVSIVPSDVTDEIVMPVGSGPYRFVEYVPAAGDGTVGHLTLDAVDALGAEDGKSREPGMPSRVEYYFEPIRSARLQGLLAGRYDLVDDLGLPDLGQLQSRDDVRIASRSSLMVTYFQLDTRVPPFDDPRVRHAIDLAVDRDALVERLFGGLAEPVGQMVSQNVFGFSPALQTPRRDVLGAKLLLAEAGYSDGLSLTLEIREGRAVMNPIRDQLAEAGIMVELSPQPWSDIYQRLQTGAVGFYLGGWVCTSADAGDLFDAKVHTPDSESGYGRANYTSYSNPELDALIEDANRTSSIEQRGHLWQEGLAVLARELPYIPLFSRHDVYGVRERLQWRPRQDGRIYGRDIRLPAPNAAQAKER